MITLTWYNIVAIVVGIIFLVWIMFEVYQDEFGYTDFGGCLPLLCCIFFYIIWGEIFWW